MTRRHRRALPALTAEEQEQCETTLRYWTPERMAAAQPHPGAAPPTPEQVAQRRRLAEAGGTAVSPAAPQAYTTTRVPTPDDPFHRRAGRLFYKLDGREWTGSAAIIHRRGILTAAHCIFDHRFQQYSMNLMFAPAYNDGDNPQFGRWPILQNQCLIPDQWKQGENFNWDYAFCVAAPQGSPPRAIGEVFGHFGLLVNRNESRWTTLGYPARPAGNGFDFDGRYMWQSTGDGRTASDHSGVAKDGNLTDGASGGPWLITGYPEYVNGVQSRSESLLHPFEIYSPYFNQAVLDLNREAFGI